MRQYIGARYVPKFADPILHDVARSYEAFEIVQNAVGDSFTSKKPVPVGVALTDSSYWVPSGNFNSQLALVSGRVDKLEGYTMIGKTIAVFGDSWADPNNVFSAWVDELETYSGNPVHNNSDSGRSSSGVLTAINADNTVADIYIIQCGINDWNNNVNPSTYRSNLASIIDRCRTLNADCDVIIFTPPANLSQLPNYPEVHTYLPLELYRQAAWDASENKNVMVCSGLKLPHFKIGDGLHPVGTATEYMATALIKCYEAGGDSRDFHNEIAKTVSGDYQDIVCSGGCTYARIFKVINFTAGAAHLNNDYINSNFFTLMGSMSNFAMVGDNAFLIKCAFDSTGIQFTAANVATGAQSTVSGNITLTLFFPILCNGVGDFNNAKNNP